MKIKCKDAFYPKGRICTLSEGIIENNSNPYGSEKNINKELTKASIKFTESLVDILYKKGLLDDNDICELLNDMNIIDDDDSLNKNEIEILT